MGALVLVAAGAGTFFLARSFGWGAPGIRSRCAAAPKAERRDCYREELKELIRVEGVPGALARLTALANADNAVRRDGHVYAHGIGIDAFLLSGTVRGPFERCSTDFASGCAHGVIQAYLESRPTVDSITINELCAPYRAPAATRWTRFQCVHGIGHGLDMMYNGDLPRALGTCELLEEGWDRDSCYGGVFMENIMGEIAPHHPATQLAASDHHEHSSWKRLDSTDLLYPCSIMERRHLRACYEIQTSAILKFTRNDIRKTAEACDRAPEVMRPICYGSLGRDLTSRALRDPDKTKRFCAQGGDRYRPWCYYGAVKALIDWSAAAESGMAFCQRLGRERGWLLCYQGVGEQVQAIAAPEPDRARLCATAENAEAVEACRFGAGVSGSKPPKNET